ncbi:MAG: tetratricopeptide repeat protein [Thaumarchaeota archaeon]|nr:tetratricopeptide repeat protein [Nitrososphaerota archaeon]
MVRKESKIITPIDDIRIGFRSPHKPSHMRRLDAKPTEVLDEDFLQDVHDEALELIDDEEWGKALKLLNKIVNYKFHPDDVGDFAEWYYDALFHLSECLSELNRHKESIKILKELVKNNKDEEDYLSGLAYEYSETKKFTKAKELYEKILKKNPKDLESLVNLSDVMLDLDKYSKALEFAEKAIKINSKDEIAWHNKGAALLFQDKPKEALSAFNQSLKFDPKDGASWFFKGLCLLYLGKKEEDFHDALIIATSIEPDLEKTMRETLIELSKEKTVRKVIRKYLAN